MGIFDVGSLRSKKGALNSNSIQARQLRQKNDELLATNLGLDVDYRRNQSRPSCERLNDDFASARPGPSSTPGGSMAQSELVKRSKLERMMGAHVPLPDLRVASGGDRRTGMPSSLSNDGGNGSMRHRGSISIMSDHSSHSRGNDRFFASTPRPDLFVGASTTFTEMAEADCPVCLEPLSYRLAGEKPHVVPSCGHALHSACFTAVYGPPEAVLAAQNATLGIGQGRTKVAGSSSRASTQNPPGMCGVCRRPIAFGCDEQAGKSQKLTGQGQYGGQNDRATISSGSISERGASEAHEDDAQLKGKPVGSLGPMMNPVIRAKPEYSTIYRKANGKDNAKVNVVCILSIEVPSRRSSAEVGEHTLDTIQDQRLLEDQVNEEMEENEDSFSDDFKRSGSSWDHPEARRNLDLNSLAYKEDGSGQGAASGDDKKENSQASDRSSSPEDGPGFSFGATPAAMTESHPNKAVLDDLRLRITDWKGHSLDHFGPLVLHDLLSVRQDTVVREFHVYLFQEALLCVTEEKKKGLSRFIPAAVPAPPGHTDASAHTKPALKLKGRIYLRHIRRVIDSSVSGELSISITMDDESLDQFVLCFQDQEALTVWHSRLSEKIEEQKKPSVDSPLQPTFKSAIEAASVAHSTMSHGAPSADDNHLKNGATALSRLSSGAGSTKSCKTGSQQGQSALSPAAQKNFRRLSNQSSTHSHVSARSRNSLTAESMSLHQQWSASGGLDPRLPPPAMLPHTAIDLVLMISVPTVFPENAASSISSSATLKLRLVRSTLDYIVTHMGPRDRVCLVAYSFGHEGEVKRTGLLSPQRASSRRMLEDFVQGIGRPWDGSEDDSFRVDLDRLGGSSERIDSVTAVNVGLDVVLQRKSKNPVTGMILVNDMADGPKRHQMDLVMARAEAANVPIHCFGYGKMHDPSSLWLVSNHTKGSYTFVREWYQLRECLSGCIGSMMSIALTDVKLHIGVPHDNHFRVRKISGMPGAIISASGKDVDVEIGELRFGDIRELLVELELDMDTLLPQLTEAGNAGKRAAGPPIEQGSATDDFMRRLGIQDLNLVDSDSGEGSLEYFIDELPVFEADTSFRDPANQTSTSRLANPTILTIEIDTHSPDPLSSGPPGLAAAIAEPAVTRRRLEVLVSEMITRSLLLISRKNHDQAQKILEETRRIIDTVMQAIPLVSGGSKRRSTMSNSRSNTRRQRDALNRKTIDSLMAMLSDLDTLSEGLEPQNRGAFERDGRNFGAQQAMILRDQKAWSARTDTEYLNFRDDNAAAFVAQGAAFASAR